MIRRSIQINIPTVKTFCNLKIQGKNLRSRGERIVRSLEGVYPPIKTPLSHSSPFQLLIATILSAQCTDVQVNRITPILFGRFPDPQSMAKAKLSMLERIIRPTGFYHLKARRLHEVSRMILGKFGGEVPKTMEDLLELPGVGRKTANVVLSAGFDRIEGIAVDTHVRRLSRRIGLTTQTSPEKIERDLMKITPKPLWPRISILLILHGRAICHAGQPECNRCVLSNSCRYFLESKAASLNASPAL